MNGVNLAEAGHSILVTSPQSTSGAVTSQAFHLKQAEHVSIYVLFGIEGGSPPTAPVSIILNQCTSAAGASATAMPFRYYYQLLGGAGNDILNGNAGALSNTVGPGPNWATSAGITSFPASVNNLVYVLEVDAAELEAIADAVGTQTEYPYLQVAVTNGASASYICILAVCTGLRYAEKGGFTYTT